MSLYIVLPVLFILIAIIFVLIIIIRGCIKVDPPSPNEVIRNYSGREIETIRYKLVNVGLNAISKTEMLSIIKTMRAIQLGDYKDVDPYVPADPYEGLYTPVIVEQGEPIETP